MGAATRRERRSDGWIAPLFGLDLLRDGIAAVEQAWPAALRDGRPRIVTGRCFSLDAVVAPPPINDR